MKVSTKGRYGLRALVDLAAHTDHDVVPLAQVAERQQLSLNYLEQVFALLRRANIVKSEKGSNGGYILAKDSGDITVKEILQILEGEFAIIDGNDEFSEDIMKRAIWQLVWQPINESVNQQLASTTIKDLVDAYTQSNSETMYYI